MIYDFAFNNEEWTSNHEAPADCIKDERLKIRVKTYVKALKVPVVTMSTNMAAMKGKALHMLPSEEQPL